MFRIQTFAMHLIALLCLFSFNGSAQTDVGAVTPFDSWKLALGRLEATPAEQLLLAPGFKVERVRSAQAHEDSWVAMTFDPQGRLLIARETKGIIRLDLAKGSASPSEILNDTLL